jgi:long-chain acyl-CoA synthetase
MTRTRKVRRRYVADKYAPVIEAFYGGRDEVELATTITYEDGRQATLQSRVRIADVDREAVHAR